MGGSFTRWGGGGGRGSEAGKGRGCLKGHDGRTKVVLGALGGALAGVGLSRALMRSDWSQGAMVGPWASRDGSFAGGEQWLDSGYVSLRFSYT